jgi:hypothetical protein
MVSSHTDAVKARGERVGHRIRRSCATVRDDLSARLDESRGPLTAIAAQTDDGATTDVRIEQTADDDQHDGASPPSGPDADPDRGTGPEAETLEPPENLPLDVTFDLLKNDRRRLVLRYVHEADEQCTLGGLAEYVAAIENDKPESLLSSDERKRVYIALYQCHLPKLDDADVLDFDGDRGTVDPGAHLEYVVEFLRRSEAEEGEDRPVGQWSTYYLAAALTGSSGYGLSLGLGADRLLSAAVPAVALVAIATIAVAHRATESR